MSYPFDCITNFIFIESNNIEPSDIILIPGGSHSQLMEKAAELHHMGMAPYILPSGGYNQKIEQTEWEFLREIGISLGVPTNVILKEEHAKHTFDNARLSRNVLQSQGITIKRAILVCKAQHARRALMSYQTVFSMDVEFQIAPIIDKSGISKDNWFSNEIGIKKVMTEVEKIGKFFGKYISDWAQSINNKL